jgi:homoserine dehydrogenase
MNAVVREVPPEPSPAIHATPATTLALGLIGPGKVGSVLLDQIAAAAPRLRRAHALDLRLRAIMSTKFLLAHACHLGTNWRESDPDSVDNGIDGFLRHLLATRSPHAMILDCSGSDAIAARDRSSATARSTTPPRAAMRAFATRPRSAPACR